MAYTSDDLVSSIQRGITLPNYEPLLQTTDILALANEEIQTKIVPMITSLKQEFFVTATPVLLVNGQDTYSIPTRSIARTLRDLKLLFSSGAKRSLTQVDVEAEHLYSNSGTAGEPRAFFFKGDSIVVRPVPSVSSATYLEQWYLVRPSSLVPVSSAGQVTAINTGTNTVTLNTAPTGVAVSGLVDFIAQSGGHGLLAMDQAVTALVGTALTVASLPTGLVVGDYVSLAGTSPVVQLPDDTFQVLAQAVQCRILEAIGDVELLQQAKATLKEKIIDSQKLLAPRDAGSHQKVVNRGGLLRRSARSRLSRIF